MGFSLLNAEVSWLSFMTVYLPRQCCRARLISIINWLIAFKKEPSNSVVVSPGTSQLMYGRGVQELPYWMRGSTLSTSS
jgi:hypothetical protein